MVSWVKYVEKKVQESKMTDDMPRISAIGIYKLPQTSRMPTRDASDVDSDVFVEKCALTLEPLTECDELGVLLYSDAPEGSSHTWRLLCNPSVRFDENNPPLKSLSSPTIHRFDYDMLKAYVDHHGALYTLCPLCKRGVKVKKNVDEHDIDTMAQLREKRDEQKKANDLQMCYYTESLMVRKACEDKPQRVGEHARVVKEVLSHWHSRQVIDNYKQNLFDSMTYALKKDHQHVVKEMLTSVFHEDLEKLQEMLVIACASEAIDCVKILLGLNAPIDRDAGALLESVKRPNPAIMDLLLETMKERANRQSDKKEVYILRDVFRKVIQGEMVEFAQKLIEARLYSPTPHDVEYATSVGGAVGSYLQNRAGAVKSSYDDDELNLDDWGDEDDGGSDFGDMEDEDW